MNIIDKAIDRVRGNWHQGGLGDWQGDGPVCGIGGVYAVRHQECLDFGVESSAIGALHKTAELEVNAYSFADFNDNPKTTEEDVLLMMKKASAFLDETTGA